LVSGRPKQLKVLVVEDEVFVRLMAVDAIEEAGFCAVEASDADEAITVLEDRSDIDVVFSDIKMPGSIDGLALADAIKHRWPHIFTILTSGHLTMPDLPPGTTFLQKPYRATWLASSLNAIANV